MTAIFLFDSGGRALLVFLGLSVGLGGAAAFATGCALARHWRPFWYVLPSALPLAASVRFLHYALFEEALLSWRDFATDYAVVVGFACLGFKLTRRSQMKRQYGWLPPRKT